MESKKEKNIFLYAWRMLISTNYMHLFGGHLEIWQVAKEGKWVAVLRSFIILHQNLFLDIDLLHLLTDLELQLIHFKVQLSVQLHLSICCFGYPVVLACSYRTAFGINLSMPVRWKGAFKGLSFCFGVIVFSRVKTYLLWPISSH